MGTDLTQGSILRALLIFAIPIVLTNLIQQLYSMVDLVVVGQFVGSTGTVGVSTGGEMSDMMTPVATAFATAGQIYIAQLAGAGDARRMKETMGTLLTTMLVFALFCTVGCLIFYRQILTLLNCPQEAFSQAAAYLIITALGMPFIFGYNGICGILRGMGESKRPLYFIIVAAVINIILDVILVAVFRLEAAGTAIATVFSQIGSFAAAFWFLWRHKEEFGFELKLSYFRVRKEPFLIILKLGIPQLVRVLFVRFSMLWVNSQINAYGLVMSATNSVGNKIQKFLEVFTQGIDGAAGAMIGQNLGARKTDRAGKIVWMTLACMLVISAAASALYLVLPRQLFGIFTTDLEVIANSVIYLRIMVLGTFISAVVSSFQAMVTGAGFVSLGFAIGILDGVVCRIGFSLFYVYVMHMGAIGYFLGTASARIFPMFIVIGYFASGKWKKSKTHETVAGAGYHRPVRIACGETRLTLPAESIFDGYLLL